MRAKRYVFELGGHDHLVSKNSFADNVVVVDFETTRLSPDQGDRAIELGAVRLQDGEIVDRFQQLINPGVRVSSFIESYMGISNAMLALAPPHAEVLSEFLEFLGSSNLVAHDASFGKRFLDSEVFRIGKRYSGEFACSMLVARHVCTQSPDHKLATLMAFNDIQPVGSFHRALADSEMTASLWVKMLSDFERRFALNRRTFGLMQRLRRTPKNTAERLLNDAAENQRRRKDG